VSPSTRLDPNLKLLAIADSRDQLAVEFVYLANRAGRKAQIISPEEATALFSVEVGSGDAMVEPIIPLFVRITSPPPLRESFFSSFRMGEVAGMLWAIAALIKAPCVNRPTEHGFAGQLSPSSAITQLRAGIRSPDSEIFSRTPPSLLPGVTYAIQDTATNDTTLLPALPEGTGPYRVRLADPELKYELVTAVGRRAWRMTSVSLDHLDLENRSISILRNLRLLFATITWSIVGNAEHAVLVRVDCYPNLQQVSYAWPAIGEALMELLAE
jgi:hypothetical protein